MDTAIIILIIVLLVIFGIYLLTNTNSGSTGDSISGSAPSYSSGGGCGR